MPEKFAVPGAATPGDIYPGQAFRLFRPPVRRRRVVSPDRLFGRMFYDEGTTVLKQADGRYITVDSPSPEQAADAAAVYVGGHVYQVSLAEADALTAAGYEVTT